MIDRIELKTSLYAHFIESRNKSIPRGVSQLINEDEDVIELKRSDLNPLYRNSIIHTVCTVDGEPCEDPVKFYIFSDPRFNRDTADRYKIVFNPNKTPIGEVIHFLTVNFPRTNATTTTDENGRKKNTINRTDRDEHLFSEFKIGRIDFNVDIETHSVQEIFRILYFDSKVQKHTAIFTDANGDEIDTSTVRTIGCKEMETFYIGKGMYVLRVYDKVKEAQHRIKLLKGQELPIPAELKKLASIDRLTRIEFQIRDLYRAGIRTEIEHTVRTATRSKAKVQHTDVETEIKRTFEPTKAIHNVRTFADLVNMKPEQFDVFSDMKFKSTDKIKLAKETTRKSKKQDFLRQQWVVNSFNALIDSMGYDTALKQLDPATRREIKRRHIKQEFPHDLNSLCIKEIMQWLQN